MIPLAFELLKVGHCRQNDRMACRSMPWGWSHFPALVGLLRHPSRGPILFDTGYAPRFFEATAHWPERFYRLTTPVTLPPDELLLEQLAARGLRPCDIATVVISHFHADHVAGLKDFPDARLVVSRAGLDDILGAGRLAGVRRGLLPGLLPSDIVSRADAIEDAAALPLPGDLAPFGTGRDVFGDGSLIAIMLPGHARGQFGVLFRSEDGRQILLAADAAFSMRAIRDNALPMALTGTLLSHSAAYAETLGKLHALEQGASGVVIIPSHCRAREAEFVT